MPKPYTYYNENDPFAVRWLEALIFRGLIADGEVDDRSITEVPPDDLKTFTQCHFFAGIGGWSYALRLAGWPDDRPVWTGSCPCQPFSLAGKQGGFKDERHLWPYFKALIEVGRPPVVFGEQVASAAKWLGLVRSDLETMGYAVGAMPIQAASAGADHLRDRYWFVADGNPAGPQGRPILPERTGERVAGEDSLGNSGRAPCRWDTRAIPSAKKEGGSEWSQAGSGSNSSQSAGYEWVLGADGKARRVKPGVRLLAHGVPNRVGKLRGFGNAIDPRPAARFIGAYLDT